ncbi:hypothetical protein NDA18_003314 [Ustilago nuda]|nr:hypothetical protein NDA18_003314 [Ustilago nuda]
MNTGYGMPSRRRLRGPLHPRNRPPPSAYENGSLSRNNGDSSAFDPVTMSPPSMTPSGKKRERTATIGRNGLGSLPWEQMGPSTSGPSPTNNEPPRAEFSFQSGMALPTSTTSASMASMASMPSSSSTSSFASFRQQQTPLSVSPSSFCTAADADESSYFARNAIFSRGNQSAQASLRETSQAIQEAIPPADDPPRKRRRGLAGTIVDTALNAALYTGAAALTAYSLWSSWGHSADSGTHQHHPDAGPEADMGHVISPNKPAGANGSDKDARMPPGGIEELHPPYYENQGTPNASLAQPQQLTTPQSNSVRARKVFVSSQRNRRRPTFQGSKMHRQSTPRKALPGAFRGQAPAAAASPGLVSSSSQSFSAADDADNHAAGVVNDIEDDEDEDDEMLSRFEARMNALIAEGRAALNSTPVLQESDLREIDTPSPSFGIGLDSSRSAAPYLTSRTSQQFDSPFATASSSRTGGLSMSKEVTRSSSNLDQLASDSISFLPEPVKRTFASPAQPQSMRHSHSAFDFNFRQTPTRDQALNRGSPFVFGDTSSPHVAAGVGTAASPSLRAAAGRRVTDFNGHAGSLSSRIPRSTSSLQARKSVAGEHRPSPF